MGRYPSLSIPSGTDTGKSSIAGTFVKWDSRMELFVLLISSYSVCMANSIVRFSYNLATSYTYNDVATKASSRVSLNDDTYER